MIVCPYCDKKVEIQNGKCPVCENNLHEIG